MCKKETGHSKLKWMDDLRFYILFNSISVKSGEWADGNERLSDMESHLLQERFHLKPVLNSGQPLIHCITGASLSELKGLLFEYI